MEPPLVLRGLNQCDSINGLGIYAPPRLTRMTARLTISLSVRNAIISTPTPYRVFISRMRVVHKLRAPI
jgi:hypothetical protein